ncbi:hypothetical protein [Nocardia alni]|uniref:hypothetical protein n=1 Tax=Nocardia alni TaxID=2815723 RepID=UPI001C24A0B9|nr:hypothetical protein [Nocardia alni]
MDINNTDVYSNHVQAVEMVESAGGQVPAEWTRIREAYETKYVYRSESFSLRLVEMIVDAKSSGDDVSELRAITLADAVGSVQGTLQGSSYGTASSHLDTEVRRSIAGKLIAQYNKVADPNLKVVAKAFDDDWKLFTEYSAKVDPELTSDKVVRLPKDEQNAWLELEAIAQRLDARLTVLGEAFNMASSVVRVTNGDDNTYLPLVLAPTAVGLERLAVWNAWNATGNRCGRWSALLTLGEPVKAVETARDYHAYGAYQGVIERVEPLDRFSSRRFFVDAETGERVND